MRYLHREQIMCRSLGDELVRQPMRGDRLAVNSSAELSAALATDSSGPLPTAYCSCKCYAGVYLCVHGGNNRPQFSYVPGAARQIGPDRQRHLWPARLPSRAPISDAPGACLSLKRCSRRRRPISLRSRVLRPLHVTVCLHAIAFWPRPGRS